MLNNNPNNATGPRTNIGKQTSSRNDIKHGCCSTETLILPSEKIEDFQALEATWFEAYSPKTISKLTYSTKSSKPTGSSSAQTEPWPNIETKLYAYDVDPMQWNDNEHHALQRFTRYQTARRNEFNKAKKALDDHRKIQAAEKRNEEKQAIVMEKLAIYKEKNKPEPSFEDLVAGMKRTAHKMGLRTSPE